MAFFINISYQVFHFGPFHVFSGGKQPAARKLFSTRGFDSAIYRKLLFKKQEFNRRSCSHFGDDLVKSERSDTRPAKAGTPCPEPPVSLPRLFLLARGRV